MKAKKILAGVLALTLTAGAVALPEGNVFSGMENVITASADEKPTYDDGTFTYKENDDGTLIITAFSGNNSADSITIPKSVRFNNRDFKITKIGQAAFQNKSFKEVTIQSNINEILSLAFKGCAQLTKVNFDYDYLFTLPRIKVSTFEDCKSLKEINIPKSVKTIESRAFEGCESLPKIVLPEFLEGINNFAFYGCKQLTSVTIPDSVTTIGAGAFEDCESLKNIKIPDSVTSLGDYSFSRSGLTSVKIPKDVVSIGSDVFSCCHNLKNVTIPYGVKTIGYWSFFGCGSLEDITIPNTVTKIDENAFGSCGLKSIRIPKSVETIGDKAFFDCENVKYITIPDTVKTIGDMAFAYCGDYFGDDKKVNQNVTIYTYEQSAGEKYAADNGINYELLGDNVTDVKHKHEHNYSNWKILKEATCTQKGKKQGTCNCGQVETVEYGGEGHKISSKWTIDVPATCTKSGQRSLRCSVCGEKITVDTIPATGHKYVKVKVVKPTLTSQGYTLYRCSKCGAQVKTNITAKLIFVGNANVTIGTKSYTGKQIKPLVKVVVNGRTLKANTDYTVSYGRNKSVGTGTVTIVGKGKYAGKITKSFKILPRKTSAKLVSGKKKFTVKLTKKSEAKKYQIQYSSSSKFKGAKTVSTTATTKSIKAKSNKVYYVRVRTVNGKYVSGWSAVRKIRVK